MDKIVNFSIIIPHRNILQLLANSLMSIPVRDDLQIIVVDDASDENVTGSNVIGCLNRNDIEFYSLAKASGAGVARNEGLKHVKGKWLLFLDADDMLLPSITEIFDEVLSIPSSTDVVFFKCLSKYEDGTYSGRSETYNDWIDSAICTGDFSLPLYYSSPWGKCFNFERLKKELYFNEVKYGGEDIVFMARVALHASRCIGISKSAYCIMDRKNSLMKQKTLEHYECMLEQELEGYSLYQKSQYVDVIAKYVSKYLFCSWLNLYKFNRMDSYKYVGSVLKCIGLLVFAKNYLIYNKNLVKRFIIN